MSYSSLESCLLDLEKHGQLVRVREEVDPYLEMAAIHLRVHEAGGPALLFENVKGCRYKAASNIFGTLARSEFIFRDTLATVKQLIELRSDPFRALKHPFRNAGISLKALKSLPKISSANGFTEIKISELPQVHHWPKDGGAFITLPQVYTEDTDHPGIKYSNLGMYRIQLTGNEYISNEEIGLHYQLHRGIGVHQSKANKKGQPLRVSIFIGGPPAHSVAAVMPLPENISELNFAGILAGRRFRYHYEEGFMISNDADFVITGEVYPEDNKPEGPFGDHLGYYSLQHLFPVMKVHKVYAKKHAIWPFTVVGRPPQEDTSFGQLIHKITGSELQREIPGLKELHAVDAAGVHPLLLAVGSERYTPYQPIKQPSEILTIANRILGTGQLSLAKYLFITAQPPGESSISTNDIREFFSYVLARMNPERDIHFYTNTSIDTLDYSGTGLNSGSKVVVATYGDQVRTLATEMPDGLKALVGFDNPRLVMPGVIALRCKPFADYQQAAKEMEALNDQYSILQQNTGGNDKLNALPLIVICDDPDFVTAAFNNFLWVTFTRSNPSHDIYGINSFTSNKHWGCKGPLIIDARAKPHHAPVLEKDPGVEKRIDRLFEPGGSLNGI